jgi:tetratricopeptide (TPR) repeat protein
MKLKILLLILPVFLLIPRISEGKSNRKKAAKHYKQAEQYYSSGEFKKALKEYQTAIKHINNPLLLINIAQCYRHLKKYDKARFFYNIFLERVPGSPYIKEVKKIIIELNKKIKQKHKTNGKISVVSKPGGADVFLDTFSGEPKGKTPIVLKASTGTHLIVLKKKGFNDISKQINVKTDQISFVKLNLKPVEDLNLKLNEEKNRNSVTKKWWFLTGLGTTAVFTAGSIIFGIMTYQYQVKWDNEHNPDDRTTGLDYRNYADLFLGAAIISGAVTFTAYLLNKKSTPKINKKVSGFNVLPTCSKTGCGIFVNYKF